MSQELSRSERLRFTKSYTFENDCDAVIGDTGHFEFTIQSHPFPQNMKASRAIFTLNSFYIVGQTAVQRASGSVAVDDSGYDIRIGGIGLENSIINQSGTPECGVRSGAFQIVNKDAGSDNANSNVYQRVSGGVYEGPSVLCSNPIGTRLEIKIYSWDAVVAGGQLPVIPDNGFLVSRVNFSIELIPDF